MTAVTVIGAASSKIMRVLEPQEPYSVGLATRGAESGGLNAPGQHLAQMGTHVRFMSQHDGILATGQIDSGGLVLHAEILSTGADPQAGHNQRAFGRFYTPASVASQLASRAVAALGDLESLTSDGIDCIDPFCGDGRLVVAAMLAAQDRNLHFRQWRVTLWDLDADATAHAEHNVRTAAGQMGLDLELRTSSSDAFSQLGGHEGSFDLVITNPPWEALKPDRREMAHMDAEQTSAYIDALKAYDTALATALPLSQPSRKFSGWGTNLSRCGLELSMRLSRQGVGACAIVLPAAVLGDQTTRQLRVALFEQFAVRHVAHYPAEARLFAGVDQPFVTLVATSGGPTTSVTLERHGIDGLVCDSTELGLVLSEMENVGFRLPCEIPGDLMDTFAHLGSLPSIGSMENKAPGGLWMGRELDETGYAGYTHHEGSVPFVKGRMVARYAAPKECLFMREETRPLPESIRHSRIVWRDVSRRSQRRRMQATLLRAGAVTGNSLHVAYLRDDDEDRLLALLALLNSLPVELQVRSGLGTGHVSLGAVREVRIPSLDDRALVSDLAAMARRALAGHTEVDSQIETLVASLYGIDQSRMRRIERFCVDPYSDCSC